MHGRTDESYGTVQLDERGRIRIPAELRDDLGLGDETAFRIRRDGNDVRLVREHPELDALTWDVAWDGEASRGGIERADGEGAQRLL